MSENKKEPTVTKKYHIQVPTDKFGSPPCVYKIYFGKKYLIWKGKSLLQSCEYMADGIERYLRKEKDDETDYLYHVCNHIKRTRCIKAYVDVIDSEFTNDYNNAIDGLSMLKLEQRLLDEAEGDELCLNNNAEAYVSTWISEAHKEKFNEFLKRRNAANKNNSNTSTPIDKR